jgi:hypothetical protein
MPTQTVGKWWDQQMEELEVLHKKQLPQVARAIAEAACGEEFAVSVTLSTAEANGLAADAKLPDLKAALKADLITEVPDHPDLQEAVATPTMLTLSASFDDRAAACAAYPAWKAKLTQPLVDKLATSLLASPHKITEAFVSKHMRKTPKGT